MRKNQHKTGFKNGLFSVFIKIKYNQKLMLEHDLYDNDGHFAYWEIYFTSYENPVNYFD